MRLALYVCLSAHCREAAVTLGTLYSVRTVFQVLCSPRQLIHLFFQQSYAVMIALALALCTFYGQGN